MAAPQPNVASAYGVSRGTRAVQFMIEHAPSTGGLALWMHHVNIDNDALQQAPVANDGKTLYYAPRFERLPLEEQLFWVAHQTLHVAFRHVQRREQLAAVLGDIDDTLYNACADALVNSSLSHLEWLQVPKGAVHLDQLMQRTFNDEQAVESLLLQWDVESLYRAVDDRKHATGASKNKRHSSRTTAQSNSASSQTQESTNKGEKSSHSGDKSHVNFSDTNNPPEPHGDENHDDNPSVSDGPLSAVVRALARAGEPDLLPSASEERPEDTAEATRQWADRLTRSHASDGGFSMLRTLSADVPRARTPWSQVLRRSLTRGLIRDPALSWSRPSRSWLASKGRTLSGRRLPWEPGIVTSKSVPRLAVILDISGSIDDQLLTRFTGQLDAITRQLEAQIVLIAGDDQVRYEEQRVPGRSGLDSLAKIEGGGGTNFSVLIEAAACYSPDYAVVLSDLQGPAGIAPAFPVLWAVEALFAHVQPPFGRLLVLAD